MASKSNKQWHRCSLPEPIYTPIDGTSVYSILMDKADVQLYIDTGDETTTKAHFDELHVKHSEIEKVFGEPLKIQTF